jgi:hypothetical protein
MELDPGSGTIDMAREMLTSHKQEQFVIAYYGSGMEA